MLKAGCHSVTVAIPRENVAALDRMRGHNRTKHVNRAVQTYLDIQGPARNRYGVDCDYFREKLGQLMSRIHNYTPEELSRALSQMAQAATPGEVCEREMINESV